MRQDEVRVQIVSAKGPHIIASRIGYP